MSFVVLELLTRQRIGFRIRKINFCIVCTCLECQVVVTISAFTASIERFSSERSFCGLLYSLIFEFYLETTSTSTMGKPTYLVLLNLLVATLVAAEEELPF
ncbi:unnamed protein product [Albugo candida]|uniref:Uncharacterized protein n=1 Tax=Albugo candida TaxID=65357 RepID=A0A024GVU1_9STRA|nr:unnamed protein product [Albugo candida]|eukprot:CCI50838.1 unnamed protein product [Albugo candida]